MLDKLKIDDFEKHIGDTFKATPQEGEAFDLELRRADPSPYQDAKESAGERDRDPFSVEFHARLPHYVEQQIFSIEHEKLGEFDLFLVPLGPDAEGHRYEAVFG